MAPNTTHQVHDAGGGDFKEAPETPDLKSVAVEQPDKRRVYTAVAAAIAGSTIEWYEFLTFGVVMGLVFEKSFVPPQLSVEAKEQLINIIFFTGFAARPIGGALAGHFGDKYGRKAVLIATLLAMGIATFVLGLLPSYKRVGTWSYVLLLIFRILQGVALGGEWGGGITLAFEYAPWGQECLYASIPQVGLPLGLMISSGTVAVLTKLSADDFADFGWRIAFFLSASLVLVGLYIRLSVLETPTFVRAVEDRKIARLPFLEIFRKEPRNTLLALGALWADGLAFNTFAVWIIPFLTRYHHPRIQRIDALGSISIASFTLCLGFLFFGWLSDKIGPKKVFAAGAALMGPSAFIAFAIYRTASSDSLWKVYVGQIIGLGIFYSPIAGVFPGLTSLIFPVEARYSGISFIYQFSRIYGSGTVPMITAALYHRGHNTNNIAWYFTAVGLFAATCTLFLKPEAHRKEHEQLQERRKQLREETVESQVQAYE